MNIEKLMKITVVVFCIITAGIIMVSCGKRNESDIQPENGIVLNYGDPSVDGCGWMLVINKVVYSPVNLNASFQKDSLNVVVEYQPLNSTFKCGWGTTGYQQIKITNIKRR